LVAPRLDKARRTSAAIRLDHPERTFMSEGSTIEENVSTKATSARLPHWREYQSGSRPRRHSRMCLWKWRRARSMPWSARTAPGRARSSRSSPGSTNPTPAPSCSMASRHSCMGPRTRDRWASPLSTRSRVCSPTSRSPRTSSWATRRYPDSAPSNGKRCGSRPTGSSKPQRPNGCR